MAATTRDSGFWQSVRHLPERTPLRTKLITAVLALVVIALAAISVASISILKDTLLAPDDNFLTSNIGAAAGQVGNFLISGQTRSSSGIAIDWVSAGKIQQVWTPVSDLSSGNGPYPFRTPTPIPGPAIQTNSAWLAANSGHLITLPAQSGSGQWRVLMQPVTSGRGNGTVVLAFDVTSIYRTIGQLVTIDLLISLAVLVLVGIAGVTVIRRSLRPLTDIEKTAGAIAAGDLTQRVPERDPHTEVGRLGRSLNTMLGHIESAFRARSQSEAAARRSEERMRQFVADASHELRTPLTAIRGFAEYYRQRGGVAKDEHAEAGAAADLGMAPQNGSGQLAPADLARIMRRVEQESARMGVLVEDMLLLARLDQQRPLERQPVDLLTLAADAVHDARVVAPNRSINLTVGAGAALLVSGDEVRLRQVIGNLMSNALAHTPDGTAIDVRIRSGSRAEIQAVTVPANASDPDNQDRPYVVTEAEPGAWPGARGLGPDDAANEPAAAVLEVTDYGPGLTQEQARHAFERFYRGDPARTVGGTGLGLAIVAALVKAHGGAVWVRSQPGQGATFSIALPLAPEAVEGADHDDPDERNGSALGPDEQGFSQDGFGQDRIGQDGISQDGFGQDGFRQDEPGDDGFRQDETGQDEPEDDWPEHDWPDATDHRNGDESDFAGPEDQADRVEFGSAKPDRGWAT
jgi:two-component system, OmpR family, sensor kinase